MYSKFDPVKKGAESSPYSHSDQPIEYPEPEAGKNDVHIHDRTQQTGIYALFIPSPANITLTDRRIQHVTNESRSFSLSTKVANVSNQVLSQQWDEFTLNGVLRTYWTHLRDEFSHLFKKITQSN